MPAVVKTKRVEHFNEREDGGQLTGQSHDWSHRIEVPGWRLYDYAIHEISRHNADANVSTDDNGVTIRNVPETTSLFSRNMLSSPPLGAKQGGGQHGRLCTGNRTEDEAAL